MAAARPQYSQGDRLSIDRLTVVIRSALAGGVTGTANTRQSKRLIIWDDMTDQALVHLDSVVVKVRPPFLFVAVDLETDQTGRAPLIVTLAFGNQKDPAGLVVTTDELPRGHTQLAARWGRILQECVWTTLMSLSQQHASERGLVPVGIQVLKAELRFTADKRLELPKVAEQSVRRAYPRQYKSRKS